MFACGFEVGKRLTRSVSCDDLRVPSNRPNSRHLWDDGYRPVVKFHGNEIRIFRDNVTKPPESEGLTIDDKIKRVAHPFRKWIKDILLSEPIVAFARVALALELGGPIGGGAMVVQVSLEQFLNWMSKHPEKEMPKTQIVVNRAHQIVTVCYHFKNGDTVGATNVAKACWLQPAVNSVVSNLDEDQWLLGENSVVTDAEDLQDSEEVSINANEECTEGVLLPVDEEFSTDDDTFSIGSVEECMEGGFILFGETSIREMDDEFVGFEQHPS